MGSTSPNRAATADRVDLIHAIAEATGDAGFGVLVGTADGDRPTILYASRGAATLLGYDPERLVEEPLGSVIAPTELARLEELYRRRLAGEALPETADTVARCKDERLLPVEAALTTVAVGSVRASVIFLFDITRRKEAQVALAQSEARFRSVVENAPDGVAILRGPRILYLNPTAAKMLGFARAEDAIGTLIGDMLHPEDAPRAAERIALLMQKRERLLGPAEYRSRRIDGVEITVEISSIPIEYEGAPSVLAFARDVTERKAIQSRLIQADRLAALGTLAAGVAHEINNPLTYVILSLRYIEQELQSAGLDAERKDRLVARIREASHGAERVSSIVRDLKTFARSDEGGLEPVDIAAVVENALKLADNEIRHRARLVRAYASVPLVSGNAARLEQVFLNLLVNAAQALPSGDPMKDQIRISVAENASGGVTVEVSDTGIGVSEHVRDRVFDPFFTTKPVGVGTGLGLAICQSIVTGFGGSISLAPADGRGTCVSVHLPRHPDAPDVRRPSTVPPNALPSGRYRILVVDDEPFVGRVLGNLLSVAHDVRVTTGGAEALEALDEATFDAILCDLMMPGMSGMDFYQELGSRHPAMRRRVVFMTGGAFVPKIADFTARVSNHVLEKPFEVDQVLEAIESAVSQEAARRPDGSDSPSDPSRLS